VARHRGRRIAGSARWVAGPPHGSSVFLVRQAWDAAQRTSATFLFQGGVVGVGDFGRPLAPVFRQATGAALGRHRRPTGVTRAFGWTSPGQGTMAFRSRRPGPVAQTFGTPGLGTGGLRTLGTFGSPDAAEQSSAFEPKAGVFGTRVAQWSDSVAPFRRALPGSGERGARPPGDRAGDGQALFGACHSRVAAVPQGAGTRLCRRPGWPCRGKQKPRPHSRTGPARATRGVGVVLLQGTAQESLSLAPGASSYGPSATRCQPNFVAELEPATRCSAPGPLHPRYAVAWRGTNTQ
jgi:hypothetical protein